MKSAKRPLTYLDFVVLSFIFFGYFAYVSVVGYIHEPTPDPILASSFSDDANWSSILIELTFLVVAGIYLWWRKFDVKLLDFSVNKMTLPMVIGLLIVGGLTTDLVLYGSYGISTGDSPFIPDATQAQTDLFAHISIALLLFAVVNGFYEELFFMGLTFAVLPKHRLYALISSVFVRFIFHIYQGLWSAVAIAMMGVVFIALRQKIKSITPFAIAHAVFDVFGAGIIFLFL